MTRVGRKTDSSLSIDWIPVALMHQLTAAAIQLVFSEWVSRSHSAKKFADSKRLQGVMWPQPPREIQKSLVRRWEMQIEENRDTKTVSEAYMELSVCYHVGFGIERDHLASLRLLRQACFGSSVAKAILGRVSAVSKKLKLGGNASDNRYDDGNNAAYFANRVRSVRSTVMTSPSLNETPRLSLRPSHNRDTLRIQLVIQLVEKEFKCSQGAMEDIDIARLDQLWEDHGQEQFLALDSLSQTDISTALTEACRLGSFNTARILASMCLQYIGRFGEPNPLHWLIMFPLEQAQLMAKLLVLGPEGNSSRSGGICFHCLNARTSCSVFLPEHCMELLGTPLHWAVRSRNLEIVRTLLDLGADMTSRCKVRARIVGEPPSVARINYNPLDIALEYHLYEIADILLDRARKWNPRKSMEIGASLIARTTTPFSRYIIHGSSYRLALQRTIRTLSSTGWALERSDYFGEIPLLVSLQNSAQEEYIIKELLMASPNIAEQPIPGGDNLATLVALSPETDYPSTTWKLQQVLHLVRDINALNDAGYNALHYCALLGNVLMAKLLLSTNRVDINAQVSNKYFPTPLMQAAEFGRTEVVKLLLEAGADPDFPNVKGRTALELAVLNRQYDTASLLIEHGACIDFRIHDSVPESTILHMACIQYSNRPPLVKRLLEGHAKLRSRNALNRATKETRGWTPLHAAAYFADLESVEALLKYGADPNLWTHPPDADASNPMTIIEYKFTPLDLVNFLLKKAASKGLDSEQLKIARQGQAGLMRDIAFLDKHDKRRERAQWGYVEGTSRFDFRLEDIQSGKQGQAGVRNFVARLEEIKRMMEDKIDKQIVSTP